MSAAVSFGNTPEHFFTKILSGPSLLKYIKKCRWFSGKAKVIKKINVYDRIFIPCNEKKYCIFLFEIFYYNSPSEIYSLPVTYGRRAPSEKYLIKKINFSGLEYFIYDALIDKKFRDLWFSLFSANARVIGELGIMHFNSRIRKKEVCGHTSSRLFEAEQTNSSILYEKKYFMKFYRKISGGITPEAGILKHLADRTRFRKVPEFVGFCEYENSCGESASVALMQRYIPNNGAAWGYMLEMIESFFRICAKKCVSKSDIVDAGAIRSFAALRFKQKTSLLARRTAQFHLAMYSSTDKYFAPVTFNLSDRERFFKSAKKTLIQNLNFLKENLHKLKSEDRILGAELLHLPSEFINVYKNIFDKGICFKKIIAHGDYHLGQILTDGSDFYIIDFEGEPMRTAEENRMKKPALQDVAGMLRSFHYAGHEVIKNLKNVETKILENIFGIWYEEAKRIFLNSYISASSGKDFIPHSESHFQALLDCLLLDKAVYELGYELNNRPDWVSIPLRGIKDILFKRQN
ncbi:MAG: Maltokinase [Elusimicrobia bacterium ADurb.Bin231]|nr:MAG: Maltokinase [Elusimicrobia bacterium ADurb.Bin231]